MSALFPPLPEESRRILHRLPVLIDEVFPLPARFRAGLKRDVAELSRLLTSGRGDRSASYLGRPALLSAYLRYFLPWNIYRLCRLFSHLPLDLKSNDAVNDLGAGPLTLAASLWISRPDLRSVPLEFRCLDRTSTVLEAGKKFFSALAAGTACPWEIRTIRGELRISSRKTDGLRRPGGLSVKIKGKPAALSAAVNVYNELFWDFSPLDSGGLMLFAEHQARLLSSLTEDSGSILVVEPGIPRSGEFISLLRSSLIAEGRPPLSPCVHPDPCPLSGKKITGRNAASRDTNVRKAGGKAKWCHFAFDTEDAPEELHLLSAASGIPKERAVLSFILAGPITGERRVIDTQQVPARRNAVPLRVISDSFPIGGDVLRKKSTGQNLWGRYGCSEKGLVLVTGSKESLESSASGALEDLPLVPGAIDEKSGALVAKKE